MAGVVLESPQEREVPLAEHLSRSGSFALYPMFHRLPIATPAQATCSMCTDAAACKAEHQPESGHLATDQDGRTLLVLHSRAAARAVALRLPSFEAPRALPEVCAPQSCSLDMMRRRVTNCCEVMQCV